MNWSEVYKLIAVIAAAVGTITLIGAWVAGEKGTFASFSQNRLYIDATNLLLVSIAFGIVSLISNPKR